MQYLFLGTRVWQLQFTSTARTSFYSRSYFHPAASGEITEMMFLFPSSFFFFLRCCAFLPFALHFCVATQFLRRIFDVLMKLARQETVSTVRLASPSFSSSATEWENPPSFLRLLKSFSRNTVSDDRVTSKNEERKQLKGSEETKK